MPLRKPNIRTVIAFVHDLAAAAAAWWLAYSFRFNFEIPSPYLASLQEILPWTVMLHAAAFMWFGLYRGLWHYASLPDLRRILIAVLASAAAVPLALFMLQIHTGVPRTVLLLAPILLLFIMGGSRLAYRLWKEHRLYGQKKLESNLVLVLGAGDAAVGLVKELARSVQWQVVGLLDDDPAKLGLMLHGFKVLGRINELPVVAKELGVAHAIIAMTSTVSDRRKSHRPQLDRRRAGRLIRDRRRALQMCAAAGVKALIVPSYDDLISGKITVSQIRTVEPEDLLGRDPVILDNDGLHDLLTGKTILITGAGGSIGSELCRQIARFGPGRLVLFELNEFALYSVEQEFLAKFPEIPMAFTIGDIKNQARLAQVFSQYRPAVVFHAAAYKHVPLMEQENAWQAILNNVFGTYVLARTALAYGVEKFVLISTDKAVNPTNVMGASKRLAEMVCQALQPVISSFGDQAGNTGPTAKIQKPGFVMVRFGNVLGSAGSVIPKFREQIEKGGPITVTHSEITRYFMSIPEAAQLVLQAGLMGGKNGGGEIFVLDMGEPVKIADLARDLIRLSGLSEDEIQIVYNGLRPGEKLYEELLADDENTLPTPHPKLRIAQSRQVDKKWLENLLAWLYAHPVLSDEEVKRDLTKWVPEYSNRGRCNDSHDSPVSYLDCR
ncbi:NDP-sugar epimerase, includes UDP-GlcNAc-inverting 4,6-dehydratase FlaA1 and capsular polysaccharide biosynthesis protein EpsC [Nitrosospira briensis]|uniref:NDP-sugar epimerase, includes UDP-GlcNAc-inverting 4,6-dehydratase FlaA1 and capsular polysaccharide biosynthesis protein EpsC n=1 Tax=Nitrosospira briensis TaxID=35799 RepID=A0A1I5A7F7_9PROT|nr:nucleoside-diphosphate sugar epimerase/dehydratase [Nitrosospira briensis]SFN58393.1 NDP-sugar epimerase, includes UDP-GlcNAc-inverting 4,6-dehydratase FlaA1 and capsular polysaccharide biosynthesis protein EpsC [Nitrosospira briensis]